MSGATAKSNEFDSLFMIPDIDETPLTVEDILKDEDDAILEDLLGTSNDENSSVLLELVNADADSLKTLLKYSQLSIKPLEKVRTQIAIAHDEKINSGSPSSLHVSKNNIVIGTFHGHVLVFDYAEKLKCFFQNEPTFGSVTTLSINQDETRLICGGSKGLIALWNLTSGELLRTIADVHAPFSSAIHLEYLSDPNYAILSDTSGSVFMLDTRKKDFDSKCVFTGSRGEVLSLQPLVVHEMHNFPDYAGLEDLCLTAMATISKVLVISIKPSLVVYFTHPLEGGNEFLPFLGWNFEFKSKNRHKPLLAFGRKDYIYIARMVTDFVEKINFVLQYRFKTTNYTFQHACWFQNKSLLVVDVQENVHLVNVAKEEEMELLDISNVELVYESSNYKSLANGGYVSRAMAKAGEHACTNSFGSSRTQDKLYILGVKSLYEVTFRSWKERIEFYNNRNDFVAIVQLLREYTRLENASEEIIEQFRQTFDHFEEFLFANNFLKLTDEPSVRKLLTLVLNYYFSLHFPNEKLFELFERLAPNTVAKNVFIEYLEHYIFDNQIDTLNPTLVRQMTEHYLAKGWCTLLDSILINLSITSMDIDHLIKISLKHALYDTYIYIHNCAFQDFLGPFNVLSNLLADKMEGSAEQPGGGGEDDEDVVRLGNKLLVYLNCMLTCVYYPNKGRLEPDQQTAHLTEVYHLLTRKNEFGLVDKVHTLLKYDCNEFLNVLLIAFDFLDKHSNLVNWKQTVIDVLIAEFVHSDNKANYSLEQCTAFFIFLARNLLFSPSIFVAKHVFDIVVNFLFTSEAKRFDERQQLLIQMLDTARLACDEQLFVAKGEASAMYQICEHILNKREDWIGLFRIYLKDPFKSETIFDYINSIFSQTSLLKSESYGQEFLQIIFEHFLPLMKINGSRAVDFFYQHYEDKDSDELVENVMDILKADQFYLYNFFKLILYESRKTSTSTSDNIAPPKSSQYSFARQPKYQELLIELACQHEQDIVADMLQLLGEYNDFNALRLCHQYQNIYGEAYLYEKVKNYDQAFEIMFTDFRHTIIELLKSTLADIAQQGYERRDIDHLMVKFEKMIDFCNRHSTCRDKAQEKYWLQLLECLIDTKILANNIHKLTDTVYLTPTVVATFEEDSDKRTTLEAFIGQLNEQLKCLFEKLIHSMLTHLNLVTCFDIILNRVLQHKEDVYDIREILLCILDNYNYEKTLLGLTNNILLGEQYSLVEHYKLCHTRPNRTQTQLVCGLCLCPLADGHGEEYLVFNCSHIYHQHCLHTFREENQLTEDQLCPQCHHQHLIDPHQLVTFTQHHHRLEEAEVDQVEAQQPRAQSLPKLDNSQLQALKYLHANRLRY